MQLNLKQIAQQLSNRAQAAIDLSGKAVHALMDTVLLALALLFAGLASLCLLGVQAIATRPTVPDNFFGEPQDKKGAAQQ